MNQSHTDKMAKEKSNKGTELISPEKIKKEPEDVIPVSAAKSTSISKTITVLTSPPGSTKASTTQPKTILLVQTVNSRTGGIQSLLLPQGLRSLPTTTSDITFSASRAKMSTLLTVTSSAGKSPLTIVPKMTESLLTSATGHIVGKAGLPQVVPSQIQAQNDIKSIVRLSSAAAVPSVLPKVCELTFNSRTIKADGTVCTLKEYLCNFCQFKVASQSEFHEHFMTHVFSCNYCSFRAFTRYEVLSHKKEKHQGIAEELAGYEGLDGFSEQMNSLIADFHCQTPASTQLLVVSTPVSSAGESTTTTDSEGASMVIVSSKPSTATSSSVPSVRAFSSASPIAVQSCLLSSPTSLVSVNRSVTLSAPVLQTSQPVVTAVSTPVVSAAFTAQQKTPAVVTSATPSPAILPVSTVKTTASVGKANDNYFTYKIVHDAAGKVQAYECDVCSYRSTKINEIFGHASTHSLTDLMKSNNVNVQWECFYCSFTSVLQANVVSHVIAKHPNKPIQLKRMVTNATPRSTSRSVLLRSTNFPTDAAAASVTKATPSPPIKKEKGPEETPSSAAAAATAAAAAGKKPDEADDGCMWGCYYCSVQSVDRNEIILHLKKDHAQQKLVITRRRITHIPAPHAAKADGNPDATEISSDSLPNDSEAVPSERTNSDVQIGDIDSTDPQHSLLKSRRKQVFPRKVFDDVTIDEAGGESSKATEVTDTTTMLGSKGKHRIPNPTKSKDSAEQTDGKQADVITGKRGQRKSEESATKRMKYDNSAGKDATKLPDMIIEANAADDDDADADASAAMIVIDGQDGVEDNGMPALEDVSNFIRLKSAPGKVSTPQISLANECTGQVAVTSCPVNEVTPEPDKEMPVLQPELSVPPVQVDGKFSNQQGQGNGVKEKDSVALEDMNLAKDWPDDISLVDSKLFRFDNVTLEAHCNSCNLTTQGLNARNHMREHVMTHTGGHLWTCPYCPFKCGRRSVIFRHVQNKHKSRPLRLIQRKVYTKSSGDGNAAGSHSGGSDSSKTEFPSLLQRRLREHSFLTKLKGPRTVKERSIIRTSTHMWQCAFCGRRNVFKGALKIHLKVAHPNKDCKTKLKRLARPGENRTKKPICAEGVVDIVPIEDMHLYETLSTLLLDNGVSLVHDLDIDDEGDDDDTTTAVNRATGTQKYKCTYCHFRNSNTKTVKSHVLQVHPGESVIISDQRASRRTYSLFMCIHPECSFYTNRQELMTAHCCKGLAQATDKVKVASNCEEQLQSSSADSQPSSDALVKPRSQSKSQVNLDSDSLQSQSEPPKSVDISVPGSENRPETSYTAGNLRKRLKTLEGPIDYNDDGTLKGVELEHGSTVLQCRYCDYPKTSDPVEIKDHLASKHPRLKPIAIDVDAKEKGGLACLFVCSVFGCDYSSHYSNVFEHHMNLEHPDVESSNRLVKKKRTHKRTSTDKARIQNDLSNLSDKNEPDFCKDASAEETPAMVRASSKSSDDKDLLPIATLSSPATSTFSQPALSPVGTVASDVSNAFADSPALGSPDDLSTTDASVKETKLLKKPRSKPRESFDYPVRFECVQCSFRIGSLEEMKGHLVAKHRDNFRNFYCIDRRARELRKRQKVLFCRDEHCSFYCKFEEELESHEKYNCTFAGGVRHHQKTTQDNVLQYMDSVVKVNPSGVTNDGTKLYQISSSSSRGAMVDVNNKMYQCSHCTFITTDLHNIRMHVIAEHAATEGGFAEIKTELGTDGNLVMNVNDRGVRELGGKSALNVNLGCEKNVIRESRSMYDAVDTVKIDDEEKVYTVL